MMGDVIVIADRRRVEVPPAPKRRPIDVVRKEFNDRLWLMFKQDQRPPCEGRSKYYTDYDPEDRPSMEQADLMCRLPDGSECPARRIHDELARMEKPDKAVIAGLVWEEGKLIREENEIEALAA